MPAQMPRCTDCGTTLKSVPPWLATASVRFTCSACPRRSARPAAVARFEAPLEVSLPALAEPLAVDEETEDVTEETEDLELEAISDDADGPIADETIADEPMADDKDV